MTESAKTNFLVGFEHLKAGYWGVISARSESEIRAKWPELTIVRDRPRWMSEEEYANYAEHAYDIDGPPYGILNIIIDNRRTGRLIQKQEDLSRIDLTAACLRE